jgi:flagellar hook-associated protein 3 FlgL
MRVATETLFRTSTSSMQAHTAQLAKVQQQIGSGRQFQHAHEAPSAAASVMEWEASLVRIKGQEDASGRAEHRLGLTENALDDARMIMERAKELLISAGNGAFNDQDRALVAVELEGLSAEWRVLANRDDGSGQSLFGGTALGVAFDAAGVYQGSPDNRRIEVADGQQVRDGIPGDQVFGDIQGQSSFAWLDAAVQAVRETDPAVRKAALDEVQSGVSAMALNTETRRTEVGVQRAALDRAATWRDTATSELTQSLARLRDTDLIDAATQLSRHSTQLSAAQTAYLQVSSLSLFDRLR